MCYYDYISSHNQSQMSKTEQTQESQSTNPPPTSKIWRNIFIVIAVVIVLKIISYSTHAGAEYGSLSQRVLTFVDMIIPWPSRSQEYEQEQYSVESETIDNASDSEEYLTDSEEAVDEELAAYNGDYLYKTETFSDAAVFYRYYSGWDLELSETLDSIIYNVPDGHYVYVLKKIDKEVVKIYCDGHTGYMDKSLLRD